MSHTIFFLEKCEIRNVFFAKLENYKDNEIILSETVEEAAKLASYRATYSLLPAISDQQYEIVYNRFLQWWERKNIY